MEMKGDYHVPGTVQSVWDQFQDPDVLCRCIPGAKSVILTGDGAYEAQIVAKIGPVKASFKGKAVLADLNPPHSFTLTGSGSGGPAGSASGEAKVTLVEKEGGVLLSYQAKVSVQGKLAQIGQRLIDSVARKMVREFFDNYNKFAISSTVEASSEETVAQPKAEKATVNAAGLPFNTGKMRVIGLAGAAIIVAILLMVMLS